MAAALSSLAVAVGLLTPHIATADPGGGNTPVVSSSDIAQARANATALQQQLTDLDRRMQIAHEQLVGVQDQLAQVVGAHLDTEQYGDSLARQRELQRAQAQQRVRDFYMSGGDLGLYASMLSGDNPVDAYLRVQAVDTVVNS